MKVLNDWKTIMGDIERKYTADNRQQIPAQRTFYSS